MIFKEAVLFLRSENISGPVSMALNCAPPFQISGYASVGQCPGPQLILVTPLLGNNNNKNSENIQVDFSAPPKIYSAPPKCEGWLRPRIQVMT